MLKKLRE